MSHQILPFLYLLSLSFSHRQHLYWIDAEQIENAEMSLNEIKTCIADWKTESGLSIDAILQQEDAAPMNERRPILLLGELANPHRLANINAGPLPIINVRIDDFCRTWTDTLDPRMMNPGVHHVTVARTSGWWEASHLGFATMPQVRHLMEHLEDGSRGKWKPGKLTEGRLHILHDATLAPPTMDELVWDGETSVLRLNDLNSMDLNFLSMKSSLPFTPVKVATIIVDGWLDVSITNIVLFTTTSTEEALLDNGMT